MEHEVIYQGYATNLIKPRKVRNMETVVVGIDSETCRGEPITIQLYSDDQPNLNTCLFVEGTNSTAKLFNFLGKHCKPKTYYRIYGHNLKFDAISFFWSKYHDLVDIEGFDFSVAKWQISGFYGQPTFFRATRGTTRIDFVDSYLWFSTSLAHAADMHFPDIPKLPMPKGLGTTVFTKKDKDFVEYAMQDSIIAAKLGRLIENMHKDFEIAPCISLAGMSARIFLTHFLKDPIVAVPEEYVRGAVCAYHGGKNNVITNAAPAWHMGINAYDLSSAYPYSMTFMPGYSNEDCYKEYSKKRGRIKEVPANGVYLISGKVADCEWPSIFAHNFEPIVNETVADLWVSGYDLNEALRTDEIKLTAIQGIYYDMPDNEDQPLKRFAEHFYNAKSIATDPVERFRNKIVLNSLYGKFIQTKEVYAEDSGEVFKARVAAGLFQPMIAGGITGHTRAVMHYLEHELNAVHTATDGVYTYQHPKKLKLPKQGLGSLQFEGSGDLALVRNKLYVLYTEDDGFPSKHFPGKMIKKFARHGFMGKLADLEAYLAFGKRKYTINKPNTLKDSIKRGLVPNEFVERDYVLRVGNMSIFDKRSINA